MTAAHAYGIMAALWMIAANTAPFASVEIIAIGLCLLHAGIGLFFTCVDLMQGRRSGGRS